MKPKHENLNIVLILKLKFNLPKSKVNCKYTGKSTKQLSKWHYLNGSHACQ